MNKRNSQVSIHRMQVTFLNTLDKESLQIRHNVALKKVSKGDAYNVFYAP